VHGGGEQGARVTVVTHEGSVLVTVLVETGLFTSIRMMQFFDKAQFQHVQIGYF
jgi:hypothetical protein